MPNGMLYRRDRPPGGRTSEWVCHVTESSSISRVLRHPAASAESLESIALLSADLPHLVGYNRTGEIPASVRSALARAILLKQALADVEREIAARTQSIAEITAEQNRIRENMKTVSQSTQYYERLLSKLNEQESSIERLQRERDGLVVRRDAVRRELSEYLSTLTVR